MTVLTPEIVTIDQQAQPTIKLGQFLKLARVVSTGGEAKFRIQAGEVMVNGKVELRRGAQLRVGDRVDVDGRGFLVA